MIQATLEEANQKVQRWVSMMPKLIKHHVERDVEYFLDEAKDYRFVIVPDGEVVATEEKVYCLPLSFFNKVFRGPSDVVATVLHAILHTRYNDWNRRFTAPWDRVGYNIIELMENMYSQRYFYVYAHGLYKRTIRLIRLFDAYRPRIPNPSKEFDTHRGAAWGEQHSKIFTLITNRCEPTYPDVIKAIHYFLYQTDPIEKNYPLYVKYWFGALQLTEGYAVANSYVVD